MAEVMISHVRSGPPNQHYMAITGARFLQARFTSYLPTNSVTVLC